MEKNGREYTLVFGILKKTSCNNPFIHSMTVCFFSKLHGSKLNYTSSTRFWLDLSFDDKIYGKNGREYTLVFGILRKILCNNYLIHSMIVFSSQINGFKPNCISIDRSWWDLWLDDKIFMENND
jgi:hypothetical protein